MGRIRPVSAGEMTELLDWLGLAATETEVADIVTQVNGFVDVVESLEGRGRPAAGRKTGRDEFRLRPTCPDREADPYNAWLTRCELVRNGADGPFDGVTVGVKDCIAVAGLELTWGSDALAGFVPGSHATVVDRLLDAGATILGKTNLDELTFAPTGEESAFGPTDNPHDPDRATGGSSSGSAAAVAAGDVDIALGTDAGGSIRMPASYCGVVGFKPTFGAVPGDGIFRITHSMDHVGTLGPDVETVAGGHAVIADDPDLSPTGDPPAPESTTVGVVEELLGRTASAAVDEALAAQFDALEAAGVTVERVSVPELQYSRAAWWGIAPVEFATIYATTDLRPAQRAGVNPDLARAIRELRATAGEYVGTRRKGLLALGAYLLTAHDGYHYVRAVNHRAALLDAIEDALGGVDALLAPTTPTTALPHGSFQRGETPPVNNCTHPTNLTGHPSLSLPCGADADGLPVGLQVIGNLDDDARVLDTARTIERVDA